MLGIVSHPTRPTRYLSDHWCILCDDECMRGLVKRTVILAICRSAQESEIEQAYVLMDRVAQSVSEKFCC